MNPVSAELVMVGTELLLGNIVDTNATFLAEQLASIGINVYYKTTVGDNWARMAAVISQALSRSNLVITSGGIGPTMDDITKQVVGAVAGRPATERDDALKHVYAYFERTGRTPTANNRRQAEVPEGADLVDNPIGTAPGIWLDTGAKVIVCLPGVPRELMRMMSESVVPRLKSRFVDDEAGVLVSRMLHFIGIGESSLEERVRDIMSAQTNPTIAPYAGMGEVKLRVTAKAEDEAAAERRMRPVQAELEDRLGEYLYGYDEDTLESVTGKLLSEWGQTVSCAESCTGGLISHRLTNIPGSSGYYVQGFVTYSNDAKMRWLGVEESVLAAHGAVSEPVVLAMAQGARERGGTDWGVSVSGIAGPGGGSPDKPVGLVYVGVSGPSGDRSERHQLSGDREAIKWRSANAAINLLRKAILAQ